MITNFFIPELNNHDVRELWFQQDGATCHTARVTIDLLKYTFGDRLISRFGPVIWPPRSCDLTPLDYFLWGYVKSLVYADKPQMFDHLEDNIRRVIADIRPQMLENVIENWTSRLDYIPASRGSPMPEIIFKMFKKTNSVENKQRSGRSGIFNECEERWIMIEVHINPKTSALKMTLQCKIRFGKSVNPEIVRYVLRKHMYHDRVPERKSYISKANSQARLAFAKMYVRQTTEFWEIIIFVHESKYNIFRSDGKQNVWWKSNTAMHVKNLLPTVKYGRGNQIVWGCMTSSGFANLHLIDGTMNKYSEPQN
ncbi:transposable element Tcb1 transposase [Trichonephila clavipes]|nr:transposable element Tcb1 transposase [Trichonephila clavipes]